MTKKLTNKAKKNPKSLQNLSLQAVAKAINTNQCPKFPEILDEWKVLLKIFKQCCSYEQLWDFWLDIHVSLQWVESRAKKVLEKIQRKFNKKIQRKSRKKNSIQKFNFYPRAKL
jgi:hypothetical protein